MFRGTGIHFIVINTVVLNVADKSFLSEQRPNNLSSHSANTTATVNSSVSGK